MKKIFLFILILFSAKVFGQFPTTQSLGSPKTQVYSKGALGSDSGYVFRVCFIDTAVWNLGFIKAVPGIVIRTCDDNLWLRNNTAVKWILIGSGGGSTNTSTIIVDTTYDDLGYIPTIDSLYLKSLQINLNGVPIVPTSDNRKLSYNIVSGAGTVTDAQNGLTDSSGRVILGGSLYKNTTIVTGPYTLTLNTSDASSNPVSIFSTSGPALAATATSGSGIEIQSSSGSAGTFISLTGKAIEFTIDPASTNTVAEVARIARSTQGTAANGIGLSMDFYNQTVASGTVLSNQFISKWTDATFASRTSQIILTGYNSGSLSDLARFNGNGTMQWPAYGAGAATFDASGNITSVSDERFKNIKGYYRGGLKNIMNINPISYKWNEKSKLETEHTYTGFSAQNIEYALGENAIGRNKEGYLSIQDRAILAALVNAIKEQQKQIESLQKQINKLKR